MVCPSAQWALFFCFFSFFCFFTFYFEMISDLQKVSRIAPRVFRSPRPSLPPALLDHVCSLCVSAHSVSASPGPPGRGCACRAPGPPPVVFPLAFADDGAVLLLRMVTTTGVSCRPAGSSAQQVMFWLLPLVGDSLGLTGPLTPACLCASPGPAVRALAVPHDGTKPWGFGSPLLLHPLGRPCPGQPTQPVSGRAGPRGAAPAQVFCT